MSRQQMLLESNLYTNFRLNLFKVTLIIYFVNTMTRIHTDGLEILEIRYLWNKANSLVFFPRELIKDMVPGAIRLKISNIKC